jgi:hypothetical protein
MGHFHGGHGGILRVRVTESVQEDPKVLCCDVLLLLTLEAYDLHPR